MALQISKALLPNHRTHRPRFLATIINKMYVLICVPDVEAFAWSFLFTSCEWKHICTQPYVLVIHLRQNIYIPHRSDIIFPRDPGANTCHSQQQPQALISASFRPLANGNYDFGSCFRTRHCKYIYLHFWYWNQNFITKNPHDNG